MKPTPCVVNRCTRPATLTHPHYGAACLTHAQELDTWGDGWQTLTPDATQRLSDMVSGDKEPHPAAVGLRPPPRADDTVRGDGATTWTDCAIDGCDRYGTYTRLSSTSYGEVRVCDVHAGENTPSMVDHDTVMVTHPDTGGTKGQKLARFDLIPPDVLTHIAEHYGRGAAKYEDHNWARGYNWSLSYAALLRHLTAYWAGQNIDAETGSHHLDAVIFHAITLRNFADTHPELDDRWATTGGAT